jgi:hypothetical protein
VLALFLSEIRAMDLALLLCLSFGGAMLLTMASLRAFVIEVLIAASGVRRTLIGMLESAMPDRSQVFGAARTEEPSHADRPQLF